MAGKTVNLSARVTQGAGSLSYKSSNTKVATVSSTGQVKGVAGGTAYVTITCAGNDHYEKASKKVTVTVTKRTNPLAVKVKKKAVSVPYKYVVKKAQTVASNIKTTKRGIGAVSYRNASKKSSAKKIKINAKTGKITVPKRMKKGTYTIRVKVTAQGNKVYKAGVKYVTFKVVVK